MSFSISFREQVGGRGTVDNNDILSRTVDAFRFPLIVLVIFIHCYGNEVDMTHLSLWSLTFDDVYNLTRILLSHNIGHLAVPAFFLISGYYFFPHLEKWQWEVYIQKLRKRIWTLASPYLLWNLITIIWWGVPIVYFWLRGKTDFAPVAQFLFDNLTIVAFWNCNIWGEGHNLYGQTIMNSGPVCMQMWFVRDLMVVTLLVPIIHLLITRIHHWTIILFGIMYITGLIIPVDGISTTSLFFFSFGAYYSVCKKDMITSFRKYSKAILLLSILTLILSMYIECKHLVVPCVKNIFIITGVISVFNLMSTLIEYNRIKENQTLSQSTFFIYASHMLFLMPIARTVRTLFPSQDTCALFVKYFTIPVALVFITFLVYIFLNKYLTRLLHLLSGNR